MCNWNAFFLVRVGFWYSISKLLSTLQGQHPYKMLPVTGVNLWVNMSPIADNTLFFFSIGTDLCRKDVKQTWAHGLDDCESSTSYFDCIITWQTPGKVTGASICHWWTTPGVLYPVMGSTLQFGHGRCRENPTADYEDAKGLEHLF